MHLETDRNARHGIAAIAAAALLAGFVGADAQADHVRLHRLARVAGDGEPIRLGDVARLEGAEAEALAEVAVAPAPAPGTSIDLSIGAIRSALDGASVHWGRVNLSGCRVRVHVDHGTPPRSLLAANETIVLAAPEPRDRAIAITPRTLDHNPTIDADSSLRAALQRTTADLLQVHANDLRLEFAESDSELLDLRAPEHDFTVAVESGENSARIGYRVEIRRAGALVETRRIAARPQVRTPVTTLRRPVERGVVVTADDIAVADEWVRPRRRSNPHDPDRIVGRVATRRLDAGDMLDPNDLESEILVRRGQAVKIRCRVGGIVIELDGIALGDAALDQTVEVRKTRERTSFSALVVAPGEVLVDHARTATESTR